MKTHHVIQNKLYLLQAILVSLAIFCTNVFGSDDGNNGSTESPAAPVKKQDKDDPLDIDLAVKQVNKIFRDKGLPKDWYLSLNPKPEKFGGENSLYLTAIWSMAGTDVENEFQRIFQTKKAPMAKLFDGKIEGDWVFVEVLSRALIGPDHSHTGTFQVNAPYEYELPNVNKRFLRRDGSVNFVAISDAVFKQFSSVNKKASKLSNDDEFCRVVGDWKKPDGNTPAWAKKQLAWRPVIMCQFTEGKVQAGGVVEDGDRRLVLQSYVEIGYRRSDSQDFAPIHLAGPYASKAYQPVGKVKVGGRPTEWRTRVAECPFKKKKLTYSDLASLNEVPSKAVRDQRKQLIKSRRADQPSLVSTGSTSYPDLGTIHNQLDLILRHDAKK